MGDGRGNALHAGWLESTDARERPGRTGVRGDSRGEWGQVGRMVVRSQEHRSSGPHRPAARCGARGLTTVGPEIATAGVTSRRRGHRPSAGGDATCDKRTVCAPLPHCPSARVPARLAEPMDAPRKGPARSGWRLESVASNMWAVARGRPIGALRRTFPNPRCST